MDNTHMTNSSTPDINFHFMANFERPIKAFSTFKGR